jgi:ADP-ribose pyrophosphatase YjhB (NUDIX family)
MAGKHAHCSWCGSAFGQEQPWPRTCAVCTRITYRNPIPVTVLLLPIDGGLLCVRRGIPPGLGQLALPGGFLDFHESWQQGCVRELFEETGLRVDVGDVKLFDALSPPPGEGLVLLFGLARPYQGPIPPPFVPNEEVTELAVVREPIELAFPLHTEVVRRFFARGRDGRVKE